MRILWQDIRFGLRMLVRNPGFTILTALTMALGVGACSAIFGIINAVILRPLPFKDGSQLVMIWETNEKTGKGLLTTTHDRFLEWKKQATVFDGMSAMRETGATFAGIENATHASGYFVTSEFFSILRVGPHLGRIFLPEDEMTGVPPVVILSHRLWQQLYSGDREVIGETVDLADMMGKNPKSYTVMGVMPPGFRFPYSSFGEKAQFWLPLSRDRFVELGHDCEVVGRLKSGVTFTQAEAEMDTIAHRLGQERPDPRRRNVGVRITSLHHRIVGKVRSQLLILWGAVTFLLLIACTNVANLLLARSVIRLREIAVRLSLGAGRGRVVRQLLTESVLVAGLGGILGLFLAFWGVSFIVALSGDILPRVEEIDIDVGVFVFALSLSIVTGLIFGLVPALRVSGIDLHKSLKQGAIPWNWTSSRPTSLRGALVITEIALSLVLLSGAGVLLKSYILASNVKLGFNPENLLTVQMNSEKAPSRELLERISSVPGVRSVGATSTLPIVGQWRSGAVIIEGELPRLPGEERPVYLEFCTQGYFRTMEMSMLRGRGFTEHDTNTSQPVVVVNETLAKQFLGRANPIGRQVKWEHSDTWYTIVGIVQDIKHLGLDKENHAQMYFPWEQQPFMWGWVDLVIRGMFDGKPRSEPIVSAIRAVEKQAPIQSIRTMEEIIQQSFVSRRFHTALLTLFAVIGLGLASVGIYGVINYTVSRRTSEIGLRMAFGARDREVLILVLKQGILLTVCGVAIGLAGSIGLTRVIQSQLFGVTSTDPTAFAFVTILLFGVALLASYIPARRAAKVDPIVALRYE